MSHEHVTIIGAGVSGLSCARELTEAQIPFQLLEADAEPGGRLRTFEKEGFLLDRGFQVLLTAYPEVHRQLNLAALELQHFWPGAIVWTGQGLEPVTDPWRQPTGFFSTMFAQVGHWTDKLKIAQLRSSACSGSLEALFQRPERTTLEELRSIGFSQKMIDQFFRPFLGGIFLETELTTSSRMLFFVFRMFSQGFAALPARGMRAIPEQMAAALPDSALRLNTPVVAVEPGCVVTKSGERIEQTQIVVATEGATARQLLPDLPGEARSFSVHCLYFVAEECPIKHPLLVLNGSGRGVVNNLAVLSQVAPSYSPDNRSLISVSVLNRGAHSLESLGEAVQQEMTEWFGSTASDWELLETQEIRYALPAQPSIPLPPFTSSRDDSSLLVCGDHTLHGSLQGAMESGRMVAQRIISQWSR